MKLSDLPTHEEVLAEHLDADPEYRREWERTALARAVAVKLIAYRAEHDLSQTALAGRLNRWSVRHRVPQSGRNC